MLSQHLDSSDGIRGQLSFVIGAGDHHRVISDKMCADGKWHHAVGVWDGTHSRLYLDGELQRSLRTSGTIGYSRHAPFKIGHSNSNGAPHARDEFYYFKGAIDDVKFYSRALSAGEIRSLFAVDDVVQTIRRVSQNDRRLIP